jgi:glycosyltransferase involved in cell wall biosynthesis
MHPANDKRVFDKEAAYLASAGFSVLHICPGKQTNVFHKKGVQILTYPMPAGIKGRIRQLLMLYRLARDEDADVYHCNEVDSWGVGVALKILHGKLCIFDVHEHYPSTFAESRFPRWFQPLVASFVRLTFRLLTPFTDRIVLAKHSVSADFHMPDSKKILVQNYTPLAGLNFSNVAFPAPQKSFYTVVHLGLFSKVRGWPQVLDALSKMKHKNVHLQVIGEINDGSRVEFEQRVATLGLSERVEIFEWMPYDEAFSYLLNADIGIIAFQPGVQNHVYAMPHKMFDYMAAALVVALPSFAVEVAPVVEESECGVLIDPADPQDIASKLDALVGAPEVMREMGLRGKEAVRNRYNWEAEAARLIEMYKELEKAN